MDEQTLNKKLAEWVGFIYRVDAPLEVIIGGNVWRYPEGKCHKHLPNFTESLDACFKWLVPKLYKMDGFRLLSYQYIGFARDVRLYRHSWGIHYESNSKTNYSADDEPALALCLAIEKLIDGFKET